VRYSIKPLLIPALVFALCLMGLQAFAGALPGVDSQGDFLQPHQGRYFRWAAPVGWRFSETNAGVTLISPDGRLGASLATLLRSRGTRTPKAFLEYIFTHVPAYRNARVLSTSRLPNQRMSYQTWQFIEARVSFTDNGLPVTGAYKVGVANYGGMNDAMIVGYRAADADFPRAQSLLPRIARSIVLTNAAEANGNNTIIRPKNNPLDNSGLIRSGKMRDRVREHASEGWREGMMGTEQTIDPKTGRQRNTPLGDYNAARGGYVNPERPGELLTPYHK
jgi:hypothetical protein